MLLALFDGFKKKKTWWAPHLSDSAEHLLLVRVHLGEGADLCQVDALPVAQRHDLIEGEDEVEAVLRDLALLKHTTVLGNLQAEEEEQKDK